MITAILALISIVLLGFSYFADSPIVHVDYVNVASNVMFGGDVNSMIIDCGATAHCVADPSLLTLVTDPNPNRKVRVGNGAPLNVTKVGEMIKMVRTETPVARKGKRTTRVSFESMHLSDVLVVPQMRCQLFSCAAGFSKDGISTFLNKSRHLVLPSGSHVKFLESQRHYCMLSRCLTTRSWLVLCLL